MTARAYNRAVASALIAYRTALEHGDRAAMDAAVTAFARVDCQARHRRYHPA